MLFDDAISVIIAARDAIHSGWKLTHHPLYGNYRPNQQPYRSLILEYPAGKVVSGDYKPQLDMESLRLIEEAMLVYNNCSVLTPSMAPASMLEASSLLDYELMRLPLQQAGIWTEAMEDISRQKRPAMRLV